MGRYLSWLDHLLVPGSNKEGVAEALKRLRFGKRFMKRYIRVHKRFQGKTSSSDHRQQRYYFYYVNDCFMLPENPSSVWPPVLRM